jgi:hypothetical protein
MTVEWRHVSKALLVRGNEQLGGECVGKSGKLVKSKKKREERQKMQKSKLLYIY